MRPSISLISPYCAQIEHKQEFKLAPSHWYVTMTMTMTWRDRTRARALDNGCTAISQWEKKHGYVHDSLHTNALWSVNRLIAQSVTHAPLWPKLLAQHSPTMMHECAKCAISVVSFNMGYSTGGPFLLAARFHPHLPKLCFAQSIRKLQRHRRESVHGRARK